MKLLDKLERKFGNIAIGNLTYYLIGGQVVVFFLSFLRPESIELLLLSGNMVLSGEIWRIITFLFFPISRDYFWTIFIWYIYFLYGTALEKQWGSFRYNLYVALSVVFTVLLSLIFPDLVFTNVHIYTAIFLAFAYLYPDFKLYLFFILPVKVKWLAYLAWAGILLGFIGGQLATKLVSVITLVNFLIFFAKDLMLSFKLRSRGAADRPKVLPKKQKADHVCKVCKRNEISHPDMEIRYCSECDPLTCYCRKHIDNHNHLSKK